MWPATSQQSAGCTLGKSEKSSSTNRRQRLSLTSEESIGTVGRFHDDGWKMSGWWYTNLSKKYELVNWDNYSQYMEKQKMFQTTNQMLTMIARVIGVVST